jgi:hypothetical protein
MACGIALMTLEQVHNGYTDDIIRQGSLVLEVAYDKNPNRFKHKMPVPKFLPKGVWIDPPSTEKLRV